jgi:hypothetical protein
VDAISSTAAAPLTNPSNNNPIVGRVGEAASMAHSPAVELEREQPQQRDDQEECGNAQKGHELFRQSRRVARAALITHAVEHVDPMAAGIADEKVQQFRPHPMGESAAFFAQVL